MNIKRYLYIEQDAERAVSVVTFSKKKEAAAHAAQCLKETIFKSLGKDYFIPPEHIDENGFIAHSASGVEINSSEWGWSLWWDNIRKRPLYGCASPGQGMLPLPTSWASPKIP